MSLDATIWAWSIQGLDPTEKITLLSLCDRCGQSFKYRLIISTLIFDTCLDKKTLNESLSRLETLGFITRNKQDIVINNLQS